jgi:hypothetical protein
LPRITRGEQLVQGKPPSLALATKSASSNVGAGF